MNEFVNISFRKAVLFREHRTELSLIFRRCTVENRGFASRNVLWRGAEGRYTKTAVRLEIGVHHLMSPLKLAYPPFIVTEDKETKKLKIRSGE